MAMDGEDTSANDPRGFLIWSITGLPAKEAILDMESTPKAAMTPRGYDGSNRSIAPVSDDMDFVARTDRATEFARAMDGEDTSATVPSVLLSWSLTELSVKEATLDMEFSSKAAMTPWG